MRHARGENASKSRELIEDIQQQPSETIAKKGFPNPRRVSPKGQALPSIAREMLHGVVEQQHEPSHVSSHFGESIKFVSDNASGIPSAFQEPSLVRRHWVSRSHNVAPDPDGQTRLEGLVLINDEDNEFLSRGGKIGWEHVKAVMVYESVTSDEEKGRFRLLRLLRSLFHAQPARRFVFGIVQWGHSTRLYCLDRDGGAMGAGFDRNKVPESFLRIQLGLAYSSEVTIGCDLEIRHT